MSTVLILKELSRRWYLVVLAIAVAAAAALFVLSKEDKQVKAEGSIQVLVDSANSPIANARRDLTGLTARAGVFARVMSGGNVIGQVAKAAGVPVKQIDVAGPLPLPGEAPGISDGPAHELPYRIEITQQTELPILTVVTQAPTAAEARALAAAAPQAISREVTAIQNQQGTPEGKRVEFRVLGPAEAALVDNSSGKKIAAAVFVGLLVLFLALIVGLPRFLAAWRATEVEPKAAGGAAADHDGAPVANGKGDSDQAQPRAKDKRSRRRRRAEEKQAQKAEEKASQKADAKAAKKAAAEAAQAERAEETREETERTEEIKARAEAPAEREESGARS